ncbi:MAG: hypothetical protein L0Z50_41470 [Verrucomicrobiales bacterium]|nr:hypothetical protein [Verrucomicrobiales bacterium]
MKIHNSEQPKGPYVIPLPWRCSPSRANSPWSDYWRNGLRLDAMLIHKDPDFNTLAGVIKLQGLPPKAGTK